MDIYYIGTTWKKALGVPVRLQSYLDNNSELLWDSMIVEVVDGNTNYFV
jgi:hypothetical protein